MRFNVLISRRAAYVLIGENEVKTSADKFGTVDAVFFP